MITTCVRTCRRILIADRLETKLIKTSLKMKIQGVNFSVTTYVYVRQRILIAGDWLLNKKTPHQRGQKKKDLILSF